MTAEAAQNDIELDLFNNLSRNNEVQNRTPRVDPEKSFIDKCIHPPTATPGFIGLPTNDTRSQVLLEWRNVFLQSRPIVIRIVDSKTTAVAVEKLPNEMAFLIPTGINALAISWIRDVDKSNAWAQDLANTDCNPLYEVTNFPNDATQYRPVLS